MHSGTGTAESTQLEQAQRQAQEEGQAEAFHAATPPEYPHWSRIPGAFPVIRSLLVRELLNAGNSEMADWFMALVEEVENDAASNRAVAVGFENTNSREVLDSVAARVCIAERKSLDIQR